MITTPHVITALIALVLIVALAGLLYLRLVRNGHSGQGYEYAPRHDRRGCSGQERIPTLDELQTWREGWTDAQLAALRQDDLPPPPVRRDWDFHANMVAQDTWMAARRREAHEQQLVLKTGVWADPYWIHG